MTTRRSFGSVVRHCCRLAGVWVSAVQRCMPQATPVPPRIVLFPGHYLGTPPEGDSAVRFTKTYLQQFEQALKTHKDSAGVIKAMETQWPGLAETSSLELSAKVNLLEVGFGKAHRAVTLRRRAEVMSRDHLLRVQSNQFGSGRTKRSSAAPAWPGACISGPPTPRRRPVDSHGAA
jgi:hypothetical protein